MADPRATVAFDDIDYRAETFKVDNVTITYDATKTRGSAVVDRAVRIMPGTARTVELVGDGEAILGKLILVDKDNMGVVQTRGYMTLPAGTGASITTNKKIVGDLLVSAEGYIREVDTSTAAELGMARGRIVDPTTTTAVIVYLE